MHCVSYVRECWESQGEDLQTNGGPTEFTAPPQQFFVSECVISRRFTFLEGKIDNQKFCRVVKRFSNDDFSVWIQDKNLELGA